MKITVYLTSPEWHSKSKMGSALFKMWYYGRNLTELIELVGCPNNGCEHTCRVSGEYQEVNAWLDLFLESYPYTKNEIEAIKNAIDEKINEDSSVGNIIIRLKQLKRVHTYGDEQFIKPWFWVPGNND